MGNVLIERLQNVFGPPDRSENPEAFVAEIDRITAGFSTTALDSAASVLIAEGGKSWPAPKAIVQACVDAQEALAIRQGTRPKENLPWHQHAKDSEQWAREFCQATEIGQRAFTEGWGKGLYMWAKNYAHECYRRDEKPEASHRPQSFEIEHWVACRSPADWREAERVTYLHEPWSKETNARLNRVLNEARAARLKLSAGLKSMPTEDVE